MRTLQTDKEEVIEANFGGVNRESMSFRVYVRQSDQERVMKPVPASAIALHLHTYLHDWQQKHNRGTPERRIEILADDTYTKLYRPYWLGQTLALSSVSVPEEYTFNSFLYNMKQEAVLPVADSAPSGG
jgi:hypothetical protein